MANGLSGDFISSSSNLELIGSVRRRGNSDKTARNTSKHHAREPNLTSTRTIWLEDECRDIAKQNAERARVAGRALVNRAASRLVLRLRSLARYCVARRRHSPSVPPSFHSGVAITALRSGAFLTGLATADGPSLRCGADALFCLRAKGSALARARVKSRKIRDRPGRSPRPSARTSRPDSCHHRNPLVQAG